MAVKILPKGQLESNLVMSHVDGQIHPMQSGLPSKEVCYKDFSPKKLAILQNGIKVPQTFAKTFKKGVTIEICWPELQHFWGKSNIFGGS